MTSPVAVFQGIIRGKTIELERESGLSEGQRVIVTVQAAAGNRQPLSPGEGIRRSAGSWADDTPGLEQYLEWNRQQRKLGRPGIEP